MSFKTILVHIDDSDHCGRRLDAAIRLALDAHAHLVGIYLVPAAVLTPPFPGLLPAEVVEARQQEVREARSEAERRFRDAGRSANLTPINWRSPDGPPIAAAVAHGRCADLFVVGQREPGGETVPFAQELIATTLLSTGRPLLIVPYIGAAATLGQNVLIAWNGGREASRAIADALPFLERARQVNIIADDASEGTDTGSSLANSRLVEWLRDHAIEAKVARLGGSRSNVGESLLSRAADLGTDLIVMGGYGHARVRELVLGGVTRTMLSAMTVPVMMSH